MSTILKALRRLEQEKTPTDRPLREQVTGLGGGDRDDARGSRRWPVLLGGIGAGVGAGLAVVLLVLSRGDSPPTPAVVDPAEAAAESPPPLEQPLHREMTPSLPHAAQVPAAVPAAPPPSLAFDDVELIDRGVPAPRMAAPTLADANADAGADAAVPAEPLPGSVRPFQHAERRARTAPRPQPVVEAPGAQPAKAPIPEAAPVRPEVASAPSRPSAPTPDPFPALRVERTTWHPLAERRLAVVDVPGEGARELREGDQVAGATVASIEPSGVVFRFAGRDVRRKIGGGP